jgi:hypothetical protein
VTGRNLAADERGFTMLFAIGVLAVVVVLVLAVGTALVLDSPLSEQDLAGKQAYAAANAGVQAFLYQLNENPNYWETCANDNSTGNTYVPGSTTEYYTYAAIPATADGYSACSSSDPTDSLMPIGTGTIRIAFTGYVTVGGRTVSRGIVAGFSEDSPFKYLWFTVYEALDSSINNQSSCGTYYRNSSERQSGDPDRDNCNINWITGDSMNGPMFTDDQYLVQSGNTPTFGRNSNDEIASAATCTNGQSTTTCDDEICAGDNCQGANIKGTPTPGASAVFPPANTTFLATDAAEHGVTYSGVTTIVLNSSLHDATVTNCPSTCSTTTISLTTDPVIYVANSSGCTPSQYNYAVTSYPTSGCAGDVYVEGTYADPLTIGAADDIIVDGNITTTTSGGTPTGSATLGLIANEFIRVEHGCSSGNGNVGTQSFSNLTIDAEIMSVQHSFIVDNFNCGAPLGTLTVNGAIAQYFRGAVGQSSGGTIEDGYLKNYTYDNRLQYLLPPYLFDISSGQWELSRETLCTPNGTSAGTQCSPS